VAEDKPYDATPSRLQAARKKGDVTRSQEVGNVLSFAAAILGCTVIVPFLAAAFQTTIRSAAHDVTNVSGLSWIAIAMCIPGACAACGAYVACIIQAGGLAVAPVQVNFGRLAPGANLARIWSRQAAIAAARGIVAFTVAAAAAVPVLSGAYSALMRNTGVTGVASAAWAGALRSAFLACTVGGIFAACDYGVQFVSRRARLRMSFEEMRRDHKEHEGDPRARGRRTALHRSIVRGSLQQLPNASFVVTNPTHIAVALRYAPPDISVPVVLVAAADELAVRVREQAAAHRIPVIENVPLARALFASASVGHVIPPEMYIGVAQVIASLSSIETQA
jgi:flagellar biosynthetic protein FlhB